MKRKRSNDVFADDLSWDPERCDYFQTAARLGWPPAVKRWPASFTLLVPAPGGSYANAAKVAYARSAFFKDGNGVAYRADSAPVALRQPRLPLVRIFTDFDTARRPA